MDTTFPKAISLSNNFCLMKNISPLFLFLFFLVSIRVSANNPGITYQTASYLCGTTPPVSWNLTSVAIPVQAQNGPNYGCLSGNSLNRPHWFRLYVSQSGRMNLRVQHTVNTNLDHVVWGPFTDANTPVVS